MRCRTKTSSEARPLMTHQSPACTCGALIARRVRGSSVVPEYACLFGLVVGKVLGREVVEMRTTLDRGAIPSAREPAFSRRTVEGCEGLPHFAFHPRHR